MDDRKSATFNLHCFEAFESISNTLIKTFTVDRGKEFAGYNEIEKRLNIDVYFADPLHLGKEALMRILTDY